MKSLFICLSIFILLFVSAEVSAHAHTHKSYHGGILYEIGCCENGHLEVLLKNDLMILWFVGGGNQTDRSVRIPDREFTMEISAEGIVPVTVTFKASPIELAGEKEGDCSRFSCTDQLFTSLKKFLAKTSFSFKAQKIDLNFSYPEHQDHNDDHETEHGSGTTP